jgi:hypothetical protein
VNKPLLKLSVIGLSLAALIAPAWAEDVPSCFPPHGVKSISSLHDAPPVLRQAFKERFGDIADPDERFDATDVVKTGRNRRLIFIWNAGRRWIIATERGGRGYDTPIFAYDLSNDHLTARFLQRRVGEVCTTAANLINFFFPYSPRS